MANTTKNNLVTKRYKLAITHDNNYCTMPSYLYNTSSGKLEAFSDDTNFRLKSTDDSLLSRIAELERQRNLGLQNSVNVLSVDMSQTVYPREENTFLSGTVKRSNYTFPWSDTLASRLNKVSSSQIDTATQVFYLSSGRLFSYWPMDSNDTNFFASAATPSMQQGELMVKMNYVLYQNYPFLHARFGRDLNKANTPNNSVQQQAGKGPFSDSYEKAIGDIRLIYKDYSILPEYTVSDKIREAVVSGTNVYADSFNTLSLKGTSSYSSNDLFLENYVNSDYIDSAQFIENNFVDYGLKKINITVNGVKKFIPYDGFYPQQRSLQLSTLFSQSIAPTTTLIGGDKTFRVVTNNLFSRGLFNSIRAGIACDIPMYTSGQLSLSGTVYDRVPFRALMNPNSYMRRGYSIINQEPEQDDTPSTTMLDMSASLGQSDLVYDLAANNFIAETTNFFLDNSKLTMIKSKPESDWNFDFGRYSKFSMNVVLSKDANFTNHDSVGYYGYPQNYYAPCYFGLSGSGATNYWNYASYTDINIPPTAAWSQNRALATITFDATSWSNSLTAISSTPKPTMNDIITYSTITFTNKNIEEFYPNMIVSGAFMPLSSSVELLDYSKKDGAWNIYTKWECPVHNFVGVTTFDSGSNDGGTGTTADDVHRGVWHQYTTNTRSGLNLFLEYTSSTGGSRDGSLISACGFETEPQRVGNLADRKNVTEYIAVIPYIVDECEIEKYFKIPLDIFEAQYKRANIVEDDNSIRDLIRKSRMCVLPPRLNFVAYRDNSNQEILDEGQYSDTLPPFAMYLFEFSSTLNRQDLSNIWQGVSPSLADTSEFQSISIKHDVKDTEVLSRFNLQNFGGKLPNNTRFKVFKVKARALTTYEQLIQKTKGERTDRSRQSSFNWPYDFFSLVEMAKVDVEMSYGDEKENT